jgi:hypothetical protein
MKLLLAALMLLLSLCLILSPLYLVWLGLTGTGSFWIRTLLVVAGLVLCRMAKPISVITGKDWKVF